MTNLNPKRQFFIAVRAFCHNYKSPFRERHRRGYETYPEQAAFVLIVVLSMAFGAAALGVQNPQEKTVAVLMFTRCRLALVPVFQTHEHPSTDTESDYTIAQMTCQLKNFDPKLNRAENKKAHS
ncbi:MAG: hypothetical protein LBD85_03080 [Oscillospiraceae bacterium]|nr:hypothetical protein [Oscillospiraceae bacterium]